MYAMPLVICAIYILIIIILFILEYTHWAPTIYILLFDVELSLECPFQGFGLE